MPAADWRSTASIWFNDPDRGRVLAGPFGFAWWQSKKLYVAQFRVQENSPMAAYRSFIEWEKVKAYTADHVPMPSVVRFVRTGLLPA